MKKVVVLGAGISGLAAARELSRSGYEVEVFEKDPIAGGLSGTYADNDGFMYDKGPHYFFTTLADKVGILDRCEKVPYYEAIYYKRKCYSFPFGLLRNPQFFLSVFFSFLGNASTARASYRDLNDLLEKNYGRSFAGKILSPLIEKWSGFPTGEISEDFGKRLLPGNIKYILYSLLKKLKGYTEDYYQKGRYIVYPRGGMGVLFQKLISDGKFDINFNSKVTKINIANGLVKGIEVGDRKKEADFFISSVPVNELIKACGGMESVPGKALVDFRYRGIVILFLKVNGPRLLDKLWHWYPEKDQPFYRISEQYPLIYGAQAPKDKNVICMEYGCFEKDSFYNLSDEKIKENGMECLGKLFKLHPNSVVGYRVERIPWAYPILLKKYEDKQRKLKADFGLKNLFLTGRTGLFRYYMLEEAYDSGMEAANLVKSLR